jgi:hypothetical protein
VRIPSYVAHFDGIRHTEDEDALILVQKTDGDGMRTAIGADGDEKPVFFTFQPFENFGLDWISVIEHRQSPQMEAYV